MLKLIIDRFEGDKAVLTSENNGTLTVLKSVLPPSAAEGSALTAKFNLATADSEESLAKQLLNDILSNGK